MSRAEALSTDAFPEERRPEEGPVPVQLSVIVPTFRRPERIERLVRRLGQQTLDPSRFELVVVDDGTDPPITIEVPTRFRFELLRQANAGPGAARNRAIERCRAGLCLILNDDAVPARDLLEKHLAVQAENEREGREKLAVLGAFHFDAQSRQSAFTQLLDRTDLLFDFSPLKHGGVYGWPFFWTCNISLPTKVLREAGGFDAERFHDIVEDVELGYRLEKLGWRVLYRQDLCAEHDHVLVPAGFFERTRRLGRNLARMYAKHGDARVLRLPAGTPIGRGVLRQHLSTFETLHPQMCKVEAMLARLEATSSGQELPHRLVAELATLVERVNAAPFARGVIEELLGFDPKVVIENGPPAGELTSVIVLSYDALATTRRCLEALRATRDEQHPIEILFVDNGSTDGSREFLVAQSDVLLVANGANLGAPRARNQAIQLARGQWLVFLDNDAIVTPGWLAGLLYHGAIDPLAGCIGPTSDRAAHGQAIEYAGTSDPSELADFAGQIALLKPRQFKFASLLSSFCLLVRRSVIEAIGGFDERFSPWGFEDDDFTLRAALASGHNRIALDVFVRHEAYAGAKLEEHARLLARNWRRFAKKWRLPESAAHGDYAGLAPGLERTWTSGDLHVRLADQDKVPEEALVPS